MTVTSAPVVLVSTPKPYRPTGIGLIESKAFDEPLMPSVPPVTGVRVGDLTVYRRISAAAIVTMLR